MQIRLFGEKKIEEEQAICFADYIFFKKLMELHK